MTNYSPNYSALEFKPDTDNSRTSIWSNLCGLLAPNTKTQQTPRSRKVDSPKLPDESQSARRNGINSIDSLTTELEKKMAAELGKQIKVNLRNENRASERNLRFIHGSYFASSRQNNMHKRLVRISIDRADESQSSVPMSDVIDVIDELVSTREFQELIIKFLNQRVEAQTTSSSLTINRDLDITIDRIKELADDEEEDDYGRVIKPSVYATEKAIDLISKAAKMCRQNFSKAWVLTDDSGGIYLTWSKPDSGKELRVLVPAKEELNVYLYHEEKEGYDSENNITAKDLSNWIDWINS